MDVTGETEEQDPLKPVATENKTKKRVLPATLTKNSKKQSNQKAPTQPESKTAGKRLESDPPKKKKQKVSSGDGGGLTAKQKKEIKRMDRELGIIRDEDEYTKDDYDRLDDFIDDDPIVGTSFVFLSDPELDCSHFPHS